MGIGMTHCSALIIKEFIETFLHSHTNLVNITSTVKRKHPAFKKLSNAAKLQSGYLTSKQAQESGYDYYLQSYHVKAGNWERSARGIYRLMDFLISPN